MSRPESRGLSGRCSQSTMSPAIMPSGSRWSNGDISFWRDEWEADQQPAETSSCFSTHPRKRIGHNGVSSARAPSARQIIYRKTLRKVSECCSHHILQSCPWWALKEHQCDLEARTAKLLSRCPVPHSDACLASQVLSWVLWFHQRWHLIQDWISA